jgi:hypothetical protein
MSSDDGLVEAVLDDNLRDLESVSWEGVSMSSEQLPKLYEFLYLTGEDDDLSLYSDGFIVAHDVQEAIAKAKEIISMQATFRPLHHCVAVREYGYVAKLHYVE